MACKLFLALCTQLRICDIPVTRSGCDHDNRLDKHPRPVFPEWDRRENRKHQHREAATVNFWLEYFMEVFYSYFSLF